MPFLGDVAVGVVGVVRARGATGGVAVTGLDDHGGGRGEEGSLAVGVRGVGRGGFGVAVAAGVGDFDAIGSAFEVAVSHGGVVGAHGGIVALVEPGFGDGLLAGGPGGAGDFGVVKAAEFAFADMVVAAGIGVGGGGDVAVAVVGGDGGDGLGGIGELGVGVLGGGCVGDGGGGA